LKKKEEEEESEECGVKKAYFGWWRGRNVSQPRPGCGMTWRLAASL